jgi:iron complex transport system substrate-binding protein
MEGMIAKNPEQIVILFTNHDHRLYERLQKNPLWQQLTAVKNNKVYFADRNIWGKSHGLEALELMYEEAIATGFLANQPATNERI